MERPLYRPPFKPLIAGIVLDEGDADVDTAALYAQVVVDRAELTRNIHQELQGRGQISLAEVVARHPLRHGLTELVAYLQLAGAWPKTAVDDDVRELVSWQSDTGVRRQATLPRIILLRNLMMNVTDTDTGHSGSAIHENSRPWWCLCSRA